MAVNERCLPVEIGRQYFLFRLTEVITVQSHQDTLVTETPSEKRIPVIDLSRLFWGESANQGYAISVGSCAFLVNHIRPAIDVEVTPLPPLITGPFGGVVRGGLIQLLVLDCGRLLTLIQRLSPDMLKKVDYEPSLY
jgi:hypothetical protein